MSRHLAPEELLLDYAAGTLSPAPALAVALHVALDPQAGRAVDGLNAVGGVLLESEDGASLDNATLEQTMAGLDRTAIEPRARSAAKLPGFEWAPPALGAFLRPEMNWRSILGKFDEIRLEVPGDAYRVSLLRLLPGRSLPEHRHAGYEYTVCLQGGYTDETGSYGVGDFAAGPGEHRHRPVAKPGAPCIALIVLEKPVFLTGPWGRWLNPLASRGLI